MSPGSESVVGAAFLRKATVQHMVGIQNDGLKELRIGWGSAVGAEGGRKPQRFILLSNCSTLATEAVT